LILEHTDSKLIEDAYDITPGRELGVGGFGTVKRASLKSADSVVRAVKTVTKTNPKTEDLIRREIAILRYLDHPCICRLLETFEDQRHIYIVMELIDGRDLFDDIVEQRRLDERRAASMMKQVFGALQYCHERNVLHRDLKPENIMVQRRHVAAEQYPGAATGGAYSGEPQVTLIDFGLAMICESRTSTGPAGSSIMGTNDYLAPEARRGCCTPASDNFSIGVVLHVMLVGCLPTEIEVDGDYVLDGDKWNTVSPEAKDLVCRLLRYHPKQRISASEAAAHVWTQGVDKTVFQTEHVSRMMEDFASFHQSVKLRRAALTALAMQLTTEELMVHRERFIAVDTDGNGRISKEELVNSIAAASPMCATEVMRWTESIFDSIDTDGSQEIDYTEWIAAALHEGACRSEEAMRAAFRVFDVDGNGIIDESEFAKVLVQTPQEVACLLSQYDLNGDGVIDFEEFKDILSFRTTV
jgi:calcium-dependent protein kinase